MLLIMSMFLLEANRGFRCLRNYKDMVKFYQSFSGLRSPLMRRHGYVGQALKSYFRQETHSEYYQLTGHSVKNYLVI